jgi:hypothetical protein
VTLPLTVSPQLAAMMSEAYGTTFHSLPNCAPVGGEAVIDVEASLATKGEREEVVFLFHGGITPHRGLDKLVGAWGKVDKRARLWVRGPDSPEKAVLLERARQAGLLDRSVFFPDAVPESELIARATKADIGLVPYEPTSVNNRYCCPNKLSQYMAAGLPIICNRLDYVSSIVEGNDIGTTVDFSDEAALVATINDYVATRDELPTLSRRAHHVFETMFNWQNVSRKAYDHVGDIAREAGSKGGDFDFNWVAEIGSRKVELSTQEELIVELECEISRLNTTYTEHQAGLQAELDRLNSVYPEEIRRLNEAFAEDSGRLNKAVNHLAAELADWTGRYGRLRRLDDITRGLARRLIGQPEKR